MKKIVALDSVTTHLYKSYLPKILFSFVSMLLYERRMPETETNRLDSFASSAYQGPQNYPVIKLENKEFDKFCTGFLIDPKNEFLKLKALPQYYYWGTAAHCCDQPMDVSGYGNTATPLSMDRISDWCIMRSEKTPEERAHDNMYYQGVLINPSTAVPLNAPQIWTLNGVDESLQNTRFEIPENVERFGLKGLFGTFGNSGSPVIDAGKVVGIVVGIKSKESYTWFSPVHGLDILTKTRDSAQQASWRANDGYVCEIKGQKSLPGNIELYAGYKEFLPSGDVYVLSSVTSTHGLESDYEIREEYLADGSYVMMKSGRQFPNGDTKIAEVERTDPDGQKTHYSKYVKAPNGVHSAERVQKFKSNQLIYIYKNWKIMPDGTQVATKMKEMKEESFVIFTSWKSTSDGTVTAKKAVLTRPDGTTLTYTGFTQFPDGRITVDA